MGKMIDNERLARLANALDARMRDYILAEEDRARLAETELQEAIDGVEDLLGGKAIVYLTQLEFNALSDTEKNDETKAYFITDAEEYNIWVGTTEELEAITERDPNTLYFELDEDGKDNVVVPVSVNNGVLNLTADRYQKVTNISTDTQVVFPEVNADKFTEITVFFIADENVNLTFPENCKWRVDPNIEAGKAYEIVCKFNTLVWLVNVMVYS